MKSFTNLSYLTNEDLLFEASASFFKEMSAKLEQASQILPFKDFQTLSMQVIKKCLKRTEVDVSFYDALPFLKKWVQSYNSDLELIARILIFEARVMSTQNQQEGLKKLGKVKHLIIDSFCEYLMPKVFVLQARIYQLNNEEENRKKSLKKCIEYGQSYLVEYLKQSNQTRLQFAQNMIIAYFEMFKLVKESKPNQSIEFLSKSYQAALKNYGQDHFSTQVLSQYLNQQKNLLTNISKMTPKAQTEIMTRPLKKNVELQIYYCWQEQSLIVRAMKSKGDSVKILTQSILHVKLDMMKIKMLKSKEVGQWLQFTGSDILIVEEELMKVIGEHQQMQVQNQSNMFRAVEKDNIMRAQSVELTSSDDEDLMPLHGQDMYLRFFSKDRSSMARSKSRDSRRSRN